MSDKNGFMGLINMYNEERSYKIPISISAIIFFFTMVIQSIEMSTYIKSMGILEIDRLKKSSIVFAYLSGYYTMFFKMILSIFVIYALLNVIGWVIIGITHLFSGGQSGGGGAISAAHLLAGGGAEVGQKIRSCAIETAVYFFGLIFLKNAILFFSLIIPLVIMSFVLMFTMYLKKDIIEERHEEERTRIVSTNHNLMVYIIVTLFVIIMLYLWIPYILRPVNKENCQKGE